jgi:hypothetical protein
MMAWAEWIVNAAESFTEGQVRRPDHANSHDPAIYSATPELLTPVLLPLENFEWRIPLKYFISSAYEGFGLF